MTRKIKESAPQIIAAFIDRIENDIAVVILSDAPEIHFNLPLKYLPRDVAEGNHLKLSFELDAETTEAARQCVATLQTELATEPEIHIKL